MFGKVLATALSIEGLLYMIIGLIGIYIYITLYLYLGYLTFGD